MALEFAYALDGSVISSIKDFPLDVAGTASSGYNTGISGLTGTNPYFPKKGDLVYLNAGLLRKGYNVASPKSHGIIEGFEFTGIGQAATSTNPNNYAATNASSTASITNTTKYPNGLAKIRVETDSVYRVPVNSGTCGNANVGNSYNIVLGTDGDQKIDLTLSTNPVFKVVDYSPDGKTAFVMLASNNTF